MSDASRLRLFALVAGLVAAIVLVVGLLARPDAPAIPDPGYRRADASLRSVRAAARTPKPPRAPRRGIDPGRRALREDRARLDRPVRARLAERDRTARVARAFLGALLRLELGARGPAPRRALRSSATTQLARRVLAERPRLPAGLPSLTPGRLVALEPLAATSGQETEFVATVDRSGRRTGLLIVLRARGERWVVTGVR